MPDFLPEFMLIFELQCVKFKKLKEFQKKQVVDFIARMRVALSKSPLGYANPASDFFQSRLGRALVLDHDVNAPANVSRSLKSAIDVLRSRHPGLSLDPYQWGDSRLFAFKGVEKI